jgi:uncharacterized protein (TIGR03000 family)
VAQQRISGIIGVILAALFFAAGPAVAGHGGGGGGGGHGGGGGGGHGGGGSFSGGGHGGYGRGYYDHRGFGFYGGFYGFYPYGYGYYDPWFYPGYYSGYYAEPVYVPVDRTPVSDDYRRNFSNLADQAQSNPNDDAVHLRIRLPATDAELWVEGAKTSQTGPERDFDSPSITPGKTFTYELRARWTENGRDIDQTRTIYVHAGDRFLIDFRQPIPPRAPERITMPKAKE